MRERMRPLMPGNLRPTSIVVGERPRVPYIAGRHIFVVFVAIHIPGGLQLFDMVEADGAFALLAGLVKGRQ